MKILEAHRTAKHKKVNPKRDRLIKYLKEMVDDKGTAFLSHKRLQSIEILFELPACVFRECKHEAYRYAKKIEAIKAEMKAA